MSISEGRGFAILFRSSDDWWISKISTELKGIEEILITTLLKEEEQYPEGERQSLEKIKSRVGEYIHSAVNRTVR